MPPYAVEMRAITKRFANVVANDQVNLQVQRGEIHALLGENGAGKSTLMNMLGGLYRPDSGEILLHGKPVRLRSPRAAIQAGIGMVHQHFMLVPTQTVLENMVLGQSRPRWWLNHHQLAAQVTAAAQQFGMQVHPNAKIWQLSVGEQQRVEILKMLYQGAEILIMDEPTAVLTPTEVRDLFQTLRQMAAQGKTIIFISHKLAEVLDIADNVTVLRRGKVVATIPCAGTSKADLAQAMVGRAVNLQLERPPAQLGKVVLAVEQVSCLDERGLPALRQVNFTLRAGEIVGLAGVAGNGQTELAEVIAGLRGVQSGQVLLAGQVLGAGGVSSAIAAGVAYVPADRNKVGSAPSLNLRDNLLLKNYRTAQFGSGWRLNYAKAQQYAQTMLQKYQVNPPNPSLAARLLSGGNLQKLILAREIALLPKLLLAVTPTRGLDVGATEAVYHALLAERARGAAVLLISEDLDELFALSDRLLVMHAGQIVGELPPDPTRLAEIGLLLAGTQKA